MVTALAIEKLFANAAIEMFMHQPAAAATEQSAKNGATTTTWTSLRDFEGFAVIAAPSVLTGNGLIELSIYAAEDDAASNATEIKTTGTIAADAYGNYAVLEVSAEEVEQLGRASGYAFTHVTAYIDCENNDDEVAVCYIRHGAKRAYSGMTATDVT